MPSVLPQSDGLLPLALLFVGITSFGNAIQAYTTLQYTRRVYAGQPASNTSTQTKTTKTTTTTIETHSPPADQRSSIQSRASSESHQSPATPLQSRTFGTWTVAQGLVRVFTAYHINEPAWYQCQMLITLVALMHFTLEAFVFKTARPFGPWAVPFSVAVITTVWCASQYNYYVKP